MDIQKIGNRNIVFHDVLPEWDLNLHLITGKRHNFLIDTGLGSGSVEPVFRYLAEQGNTNPFVVVNTHYHWDHIWGNSVFRSYPIIAHHTCRKLIDEAWQEMLEKNHLYVKESIVKCLPDLLFQEEIHFAEEGVRIMYTPGHSLDCISVLDEQEGVLNIGDNIGDTPEAIVPELECSRDVYRSTLALYRQLDFSVCVAGHHKTTGKEAIGQIVQALA